MNKWLSVLLLLVCVLPFPLHAKDSLSPRTIVAYANAERTKSGIVALVEDPLLTKAAEQKANDMAARSYFSHTDPDGRKPWHWFTEAGYYYTSAGENLAVNFDNEHTLHNAWMDSPTHKANIIKSKYTHVGIGIAHGVYRGKTTTFVVEFFAKPTALTKSRVRTLSGASSPMPQEQALASVWR